MSASFALDTFSFLYATLAVFISFSLLIDHFDKTYFSCSQISHDTSCSHCFTSAVLNLIDARLKRRRFNGEEFVVVIPVRYELGSPRLMEPCKFIQVQLCYTGL